MFSEKDEKDEKIQNLYEIYRDYIKHEDSLIHSRTSSLITIQSFVLATFGFCYQERYKMAFQLAEKKQVTIGSIDAEYNGFLIALGLVGFATSYIAWISIRSAHIAIKNIEEKWDKVESKNSAEYLPGITGGGKPSATLDGGRFSIYTPIFFTFFWLITETFLLIVLDFSGIIDTNTLLTIYLDIRAWLEKVFIFLPIPWQQN